MATIITRLGKGSALTHTEMDSNLTNINTDKLEDSDIVASTGITKVVNTAGDVVISVNNSALSITESQISDLQSYLTNIVADTTPQLGGSLDVNSNKIVSVSNGNIDIEPNGTGDVLLGNLRFDADQAVGSGQDNYVLTYDNSGGKISLEASAGGGGGLSNIVEDATPQLGGGLDANGNVIYDSTQPEVLFTDGIRLRGTTYVFFEEGTTGNGIKIQAPTSTASAVVFTLPNADGDDGQVIKTDGSGNLSFVNNAGIALTDLSVGSDATASGDGAVSYVNTTGVFTYTPATIEGLGGVVADTTPQLGGDLDIAGYNIISAVTNQDIHLVTSGTGDVFLGNLRFDSDQAMVSGVDNYVLTYDNSTGQISLEAASGGGGSTTSSGNMLTNGNMRISQRGTSFAAVGNGDYTIDRMRTWKTADGAVTVTQDSDTPTAAEAGIKFPYSMKYDVTTADTDVTGQYLIMQHRVEGHDLVHLGWGAAAALEVTFSFWVKSTLTGTYCCSLRNQAKTSSYPMEYTISSASTWEKKTFTIPGDTAGTWVGASTSSAMRIDFRIAGPSTATTNAWVLANKSATANQVNLMASTDNNFWLTGMQLEVGSTANDFVHRSFQEELVKCQRYFQKTFDYDVTPGDNAGNDSAIEAMYMFTNLGGHVVPAARWTFPTRMRGVPTITLYSPQGGTAGQWRTAADDESSTSAEIRKDGRGGCLIANANERFDELIKFEIHATARAEL